MEQTDDARYRAAELDTFETFIGLKVARGDDTTGRNAWFTVTEGEV